MGDIVLRGKSSENYYYNVPSWEPQWTYVNLKSWTKGPKLTPKNVRPFEYGWRQYVSYKVWLRNLISRDWVTVNNNTGHGLCMGRMERINEILS